MQTRRLLINSMANMRELGGFAAMDGRATQYRRFIRSDLPAGLSAGDIAFLLDYGLKTVIDLREKSIARLEPCELNGVAGVEYLNIPFLEDFSHIPNIEVFNPSMHYVPMLETHSNHVAEIFQTMADAPEGTVLFHCSAGKDRTGMLAIILLLLCGVPLEDAVADYQVSFTYLRITPFIRRLIEMGAPLDSCRSDPEGLEPFLSYIKKHGGARGYLQFLGLSDASIERLHGRLLRDTGGIV